MGQRYMDILNALYNYLTDLVNRSNVHFLIFIFGFMVPLCLKELKKDYKLELSRDRNYLLKYTVANSLC